MTKGQVIIWNSKFKAPEDNLMFKRQLSTRWYTTKPSFGSAHSVELRTKSFASEQTALQVVANFLKKLGGLLGENAGSSESTLVIPPFASTLVNFSRSRVRTGSVRLLPRISLDGSKVEKWAPRLFERIWPRVPFRFVCRLRGRGGSSTDSSSSSSDAETTFFWLRRLGGWFLVLAEVGAGPRGWSGSWSSGASLENKSSSSSSDEETTFLGIRRLGGWFLALAEVDAGLGWWSWSWSSGASLENKNKKCKQEVRIAHTKKEAHIQKKKQEAKEVLPINRAASNDFPNIS